MVMRFTVLIMLLFIGGTAACQSSSPDRTATPTIGIVHEAINIDVFIEGFTEEERRCIEQRIARDQIPQVVKAFVNVTERGERANTTDERASIAFYECTPDEFTVARIVARARLAALPLSPAPNGLTSLTFPEDETSFNEVFVRMPDRIGDLVKSRSGPLSLVYSNLAVEGTSEIQLQTWLDIESDPDFFGWSAADRILAQVSLYTRYAQRMEPGTDGELVWVTMTLDVETTLRRFEWGKKNSGTWYLVEGGSQEDISAVVQSFAEAIK